MAEASPGEGPSALPSSSRDDMAWDMDFSSHNPFVGSLLGNPKSDLILGLGPSGPESIPSYLTEFFLGFFSHLCAHAC